MKTDLETLKIASDIVNKYYSYYHCTYLYANGEVIGYIKGDLVDRYTDENQLLTDTKNELSKIGIEV